MKEWAREPILTLLLVTFPLLWLFAFIGLINLFVHAESYVIADYIQTFILIVLTLTVLSAYWNQRENIRNVESKVYLDQAIDFANKAYDILSQGDEKITDNRVAWVSTARLIQRSLAISKLVTLPAHKTIYEAERDYQRHKFTKLLALDGMGHIFTFYTGAKIHSYLNHLTTRYLGGSEEMIPTIAISVVCRFASFPENFEDPLRISDNLTQEELRKLWEIGKKNLVKYFTFREHFKVIDDKLLTKLPDRTEYRDVDALEVNDLLNKEINDKFPISNI